MNKSQAKKYLQENKTTWGQLKELLRTAESNGFDSDARSVVNKGLSKGTAFNIFAEGIAGNSDDEEVVTRGGVLAAVNILREFGKGVTRGAKKTKSEVPVYKEKADPSLLEGGTK